MNEGQITIYRPFAIFRDIDGETFRVVGGNFCLSEGLNLWSLL